MEHFHKITPERWKIKEWKNLTTLPGSYTYYLHLLFAINLSKGNRNIG